MSTSPVTSSTIYQEVQAFYQNRRSDLQQLGKALQSGDLAAAQQAYDTLDTLGQGGPFVNAAPFSRSDRVSDFSAIGQALQAGDISGARSAFVTLQSTFGGPQGGSSNLELPATVVNLGAMPPVFQPPTTLPTTIQPQATKPPAIQPQGTMPPTFKPPAIQPQGTMPPTFKPPAIQPQGTMPPTFQPPAAASIYQQIQDFRSGRSTDLTQLGQALQAGDMTTAQQEYGALVTLGNSGPFRDAGLFARNDRAQAFAVIGQALESGDLAAAQQAFTALADTFGKTFKAQA